MSGREHIVYLISKNLFFSFFLLLLSFIWPEVADFGVPSIFQWNGGLNISAGVASPESLEMDCTCQCLSVSVINRGRGRVTSYNSTAVLFWASSWFGEMYYFFCYVGSLPVAIMLLEGTRPDECTRKLWYCIQEKRKKKKEREIYIPLKHEQEERTEQA